MPPTARESVLIVEGDPAAAPAARRQRSTGVPVHYAHGVAPACTLLRAESVSAVTAVMGRAEAGAIAPRGLQKTHPAAKKAVLARFACYGVLIRRHVRCTGVFIIKGSA